MTNAAKAKLFGTLVASAVVGSMATPASAHQHHHHHRYASLHRHHLYRLAGGYGGAYSGRSAYEGSPTPGYVIPAVDLAAAEHPAGTASGGLLGGGGLLGTGLLGGNGLLGTGLLSGQGALGLGVLGF